MKVFEQGSGNRIVVPPSVGSNVRVEVRGNDNSTEIGEGCRFPAGLIEVRGDGCNIRVGSNCIFNGQLRCRSSATQICIGADTTAMGVKISLHEPGAIVLGDDCMLSGNIWMDSSDMHSIIDLATGRRINPPGDIHVGSHVWIGNGVFVAKGCTIGRGSIIGACSVVTSDIGENCLAVGVPAREIRRGVTWDRRRLAY